MKRDEWVFMQTASELAAAAERQAEFRRGRLEVWLTKKAEVIERIKESGLDVKESIAAALANTTKYGTVALQRAHITIDPTMQEDLSECVTKIEEHGALLRQYENWIQVLRANPHDRLSLDHDDWLFFHGRS